MKEGEGLKERKGGRGSCSRSGKENDRGIQDHRPRRSWDGSSLSSQEMFLTRILENGDSDSVLHVTDF